MGPEERAEVEKRLLNALKQARLEYESIKEEYTRLEIYVADLGETHARRSARVSPSAKEIHLRLPALGSYTDPVRMVHTRAQATPVTGWRDTVSFLRSSIQPWRAAPYLSLCHPEVSRLG